MIKITVIRYHVDTKVNEGKGEENFAGENFTI